jgi:hypothetical protein
METIIKVENATIDIYFSFFCVCRRQNSPPFSKASAFSLLGVLWDR